VEGDLDEELLTSIFAGRPVIEKGGAKYGLQGIVIRERGKSGDNSVSFLRDRDFDYEPEVSHPHVPTPMATPQSGVVGWRWFRHCIESYLLEPAMASRALDTPQAALEGLIRQAGAELSTYQAARWTVAQARAKMPPSRRLETHPPGLGEFDLPVDKSQAANWEWVWTAAKEFIQPVRAEFAKKALRRSFDAYRGKLSGLQVSDVLVWFSGKDLLSFIAPLLGSGPPREIRNRIRNWIKVNPDEAIGLLPEWAELKRLLTQETTEKTR
jgi:hypothetical protein